MAKSRSQAYRRLCVIARDAILTHQGLCEADQVDLVKTAAARAHLPYNTASVWRAMSAVQHSLRKDQQSGSSPYRPTSHEAS